MSEGPPVRQEPADIIYKIDPQEAALLTETPRVRAAQILAEICASNPKVAAMEAKRKADMRRWKRARAKLGREIAGETTPFVIAALGADAAAREAAGLVLRLTDYLWDMDAPAKLIHDLLRIGRRLLPQ